MKVIACIEDPAVIQKILDHLKGKAESNEAPCYPKAGRPQLDLACQLACSSKKPKQPTVQHESLCRVATAGIRLAC